MVETALLFPLLIFLVLGGGDMARGFAIQMAVQNGARAGAESAAINYSPTTTDTESRARDEMGRTPGMSGSDPANPVVTVTFKQSDGATACVNPPTLANPCFVTVRVQYTWKTATAWPWIPNTFTIDRTTVMRMLAAG